MKTKLSVVFAAALAAAVALGAQGADLVSPSNNHPFSRGFSVNVMCGGMHMRGTAKLYRVMKKLEVTHGAETDSLTSGVTGYVKVSVKNAAGNVIAVGATPVRNCPAKAPGKARECSWPADTIDLPDAIVTAAHAVEVEPMCTDTPFGPVGANWNAIGSAVKDGLKMWAVSGS